MKQLEYCGSVVPKRSALETSIISESFPEKTYCSVLAPSWLLSKRTWKTAPDGCDIHRRMRHNTCVSHPTTASKNNLYALNFDEPGEQQSHDLVDLVEKRC